MMTGFSSSWRWRSSAIRVTSMSSGIWPPGGMLCRSVVICLSSFLSVLQGHFRVGAASFQRLLNVDGARLTAFAACACGMLRYSVISRCFVGSELWLPPRGTIGCGRTGGDDCACTCGCSCTCGSSAGAACALDEAWAALPGVAAAAAAASARGVRPLLPSSFALPSLVACPPCRLLSLVSAGVSEEAPPGAGEKTKRSFGMGVLFENCCWISAGTSPVELVENTDFK
mmetsp:Transcript_71079/g.98749  ORF Transcript_71079/g.98749 Transcript_71079/m.98749 type:complete len:228 (+) Transcript_71079:121-804(+)